MSTNYTSKSSRAKWEKWKENAVKMEAWYKGRVLPEGPIKLDACSTIIHVPKYVATNIATMKANQEKPWQAAFKPAYLRLYALKMIIENEQP